MFFRIFLRFKDKSVKFCNVSQFLSNSELFSCPARFRKGGSKAHKIIHLALLAFLGIVALYSSILIRLGWTTNSFCITHYQTDGVMLFSKYPAYGRHRISWPMLIEAPIQKIRTRIFLLLWGIWLSGGKLLCTLQQSTGLHFYPLNYNALLSYAVHFTEKF